MPHNDEQDPNPLFLLAMAEMLEASKQGKHAPGENHVLRPETEANKGATKRQQKHTIEGE